MTIVGSDPPPPEPPEPPDGYPRPRRHPALAAAALAAAFLDGEWDPPAMGRRGRRILGDRGHWVTDLARTVRSEYPDRPADAPRELTRFIRACPQFRARVEEPAGRTAWSIPYVLRPPIEMVAPRFGVPVLHDPPALADWLGVSPGHLDWFADPFSFERRVGNRSSCAITTARGSARPTVPGGCWKHPNGN